jgi:hypothetical protein
MKKIAVILILLLIVAFAFSSCRAKEKCPAYKSYSY